MKKALVTGALGQDGSYMCKYLLSLGYEVWGTVRKYSMKPKEAHYIANVNYRFADMRDALDIETTIRKCYPDEIYNFAGQSAVPTSWSHPAETFDINTSGFMRILSIVEKVCPSCRVYQANSAEMFGNVHADGYMKVNEDVSMHPMNPYAISKFAAHKIVDMFRQKGMYVVSGIAFNHESPKRGSECVTRKVTSYAAAVKAGKETGTLRLGNPDIRKDWGYAGDYVVAMHKMLQQKRPDDYVIGTGEAHSIQDFVNTALDYAGVDGIIKYNCQEFMRKNELHCLVADFSKATNILGWKPETTFDALVKMMVDADYKRYQNMLLEEAASV